MHSSEPTPVLRLKYQDISPSALNSTNNEIRSVEICMCNVYSWKDVFEWLAGFKVLEHLTIRECALTDEDC